ncbi:hypothetical protein EJD97_013604, partial [Solanum chilense]
LKMKENEYLCLSFNNIGFSSDIAAKISDEFQAEENLSEEDFEFSLVSNKSNKFIHDDQKKVQQSIFPLFTESIAKHSDLKDKSILIPKKDLFLKNSESTLSSEADEVEKIPAGTYSMRKPKISESSPGKCKKSNSTGLVSKRWPRIRDLLWRSNSEGKEEDSFVFFKPKKTIENKTGKAKIKNSSEVVKMAEKLKQTKISERKKSLSEASAVHYVKNKR